MDPFSLPTDLLARVLSETPFSSLPCALGALIATCHRAANSIDDSLFDALLPLVEAPLGSGDAVVRSSRRKSDRLALFGRAAFVRAWRSHISRGESCHHHLAVAGQDTKNLTVSNLKAILLQWGPATLIDRGSPVYQTTLLMEVCKARGTREHNIVLCCQHLIDKCNADVNARPPVPRALTALILASCRGLPKLVACLLARGADTRPAGEGRFRLAGTPKSVHGCHTAMDWVDVLLAAEEANGVRAEDRRPLEVVRDLLAEAREVLVELL